MTLSKSPTVSVERLIALQSCRFILRERTAAVLGGLFVIIVMVSAWLGWSATDTTNRIYVDAAAFLQAAGQPVPSNPVLDISPLSLMRNMSVYVSLIGVLAAIVIGNRLVASDRKAGVLPLFGSRPMARRSFATGKLAALFLSVGALAGVAAVVGFATFMLLPSVSVCALQWMQFGGFFVLSAVYMLLFGAIAMGAAALARSESVGLLIPVTLWLSVTFILPQITANLNPTAAINPVAALAEAPTTSYFQSVGWILAPISLADCYKFGSARLLDMTQTPHSAFYILWLVVMAVAATAFARTALSNIDMANGGFDA
jgi:ABC-type transport system involved in multi-copper enzyme maturation permease subunit